MKIKFSSQKVRNNNDKGNVKMKLCAFLRRERDKKKKDIEERAYIYDIKSSRGFLRLHDILLFDCDDDE